MDSSLEMNIFSSNRKQVEVFDCQGVNQIEEKICFEGMKAAVPGLRPVQEQRGRKVF